MPVGVSSASKIIKSTKQIILQHVPHPFFMGISAGYGNTDWSQITATEGSSAADAAPIYASGGGIAYGGFLGYQFSKHFILEANFVHYKQSDIKFDPLGNFYGLKSLTSDTNSYSLVGKILVPFGFTKVNVYADAGATLVQRIDRTTTPLPGDTVYYDKVNRIHLGPSFGFGLTYDISPRIFSEASFQYSTGYGKADSSPVEDYIPFVYNIMLKLAVRFGSPTASGDHPEAELSPIEYSLYGGLDVGYGDSHISSVEKQNATDNDVTYVDKNGFVVGARVGYLFVPYVALQAEYFHLPSIKIQQTNGLTDILSANSVSPELKIIYPATKKFSIFGKLGYSIIYVSDQADLNGYSVIPKRKPLVFEPIFGLGAEIRVTKRLAINTQFTSIIDVYDMYPTTLIATAGVSYYF